MTVTTSMIVGVAPVASAGVPASLEVVEIAPVTGCWTHELDYRGHAEANNVTLEGEYAVGPYGTADCPFPDYQTIGVIDTGATMTAGPDCSVLLSSVGECNHSFIMRVVVNTAAGDDSIRIGTLPGRTTAIIWAGEGNDAIRTVNTSNDVVHCGDGHDVVIADPPDEISSDCEVVQLQA